MSTAWGIVILTNDVLRERVPCGHVLRILIFVLVSAFPASLFADQTEVVEVVSELGTREEIGAQFKQAAQLYRDKRYAEAAVMYRALTQAPDVDQAAWAAELYGVCLEKQNDHAGAMLSYQDWLQHYAGTDGEGRVKQRLLALQTAAMAPQASRRTANVRSGETSIYGSSSLMYRGMRTEVESQGDVTNISSVAGDVDLHLRARSDDFLWRGRIDGGYLSDQLDRGNSDGRVSRLYIGVTHEPSGMELTLGRQRLNGNGIYGYFDGASFSYPVTDTIAINLIGGSTTDSSRDAPDSDRKVYGLSTEINFDDLPLRLQLYGMEQTYDGLTERRALGGEVSYFNDYSHYLLVLDYDIKFKKTNNVMFNGSWTLGLNTNVALSLGYQRSPFLTASNAIIGEYSLDLDKFIDELTKDSDIYDAALEKTALSSYASLVVNQRLSDKHRLVGEIYHFELSDLPQYDPFFDSPTSDANTTFGLQYIWQDALFADDALSMGVRYTEGDVASSASVYLDEKLRINPRTHVTLRLAGSRRWMDDTNQDVYSVRPGVRLDWYITPDFLLDVEMGYEWSEQDFESYNFEVQQGFFLMGLRTRF